MKTPAHPSSGEALPFLGRELTALSGRVAKLEGTVSHLAAHPGLDRSFVIALQDLDLLRQTLDDLARLAASAGAEDAGDADHLARCLRLECVRNRFLGRAPLPEPRDGYEVFDAFGPPAPVK